MDVSAKSKSMSAHGTGTDKAVVPGAGAGVSGVGNLGAEVRRDGKWQGISYYVRLGKCLLAWIIR